MVVITACECFGRPPHTHVPEKARVRVDVIGEPPEVLVDAAHYRMNKDRIVEVLEIIPPHIEWWNPVDSGRAIAPEKASQNGRHAEGEG